MRRLVSILVFLTVVSTPVPVWRELKVWDCGEYSSIISIKAKFHPAKKSTYYLKYKARLGELKTALEKENLEQAEELQHLGYIAYLNWLEQMDATEYYYRNLMNRSI